LRERFHATWIPIRVEKKHRANNQQLFTMSSAPMTGRMYRGRASRLWWNTDGRVSGTHARESCEEYNHEALFQRGSHRDAAGKHDWDKAYAASNTIYVARQNNVLFSVLAQFFPPEAINDRLLLIETVSFTTTPTDMLDSLTRIIADRSVGSLFFGNYHLMDYELMRGDARAAIIAESSKHDAVPAAGRSVRLAPMADTGDAGSGARIDRRSQIASAEPYRHVLYQLVARCSPTRLS
jgi:hypothetical protein